MSEYAELNQTELAAVARQLSPYAHRVHDRSTLLAIVEGEEDPFDGLTSPIDNVRTALYALVDAHWKQVRAFVSCPLRSRKPWSCSACTDVQVAECRSKNLNLLKDV